MLRLLVLCLTLVLSACGTMEESNEPETSPANGQAQEKTNSGGKSIVAKDVRIQLVSFKPNKAVVEIQNLTDEVKNLEFTSGQQYDMWIIDNSGKEVFHWAEGKMFTQALKKVTLKQNEKLTFDVTYPNLDPGTYTVKFKVTSKPPISTTFKKTI